MIFVLILIQSCISKEDNEKLIKQHSFDIKVLALKEIERRNYSPHLYIVDTERNSYEILEEDYVRLQEGDSLRISTAHVYTKIIKIYTK